MSAILAFFETLLQTLATGVRASRWIFHGTFAETAYAGWLFLLRTFLLWRLSALMRTAGTCRRHFLGAWLGWAD